MSNWYHQNYKLGLAFIFIPPLAVYGIVKRKSNKIGLETVGIVIGLIYSIAWLAFLAGFFHGYFSNL